MDAAWRTSVGILALAPTNAVPEPSTFLLALIGLALLPRRRRRSVFEAMFHWMFHRARIHRVNDCPSLSLCCCVLHIENSLSVFVIWALSFWTLTVLHSYYTLLVLFMFLLLHERTENKEIM